MKNRFNKFRVILALAAVLLFAAGTARAFESEYADQARTIRLRWKNNPVNLAFSNSLKQNSANIKPGSDVVGAVERSLATWEKAANLKFVVTWTDKQSISQAEGKGDGVSLITIAATPENQAAFTNENSELAGRTRVFFTQRGFITEADVVLNPFQQFSTDGSFGTFDLEAALTHEIGHLLGLAHVSVKGATMHAQQAKNGVFSLSAFAPRTLSEDDRAGARSIYGAKNADVNCCSVISGLVTGETDKPLDHLTVWAESQATGALAAATEIKPDGTFELGGMKAGKYKLFAQSSEGKNAFGARLLGEVNLKAGESAELNTSFSASPKSFDLRLIGFNGQLSTAAVPVNAGRSYLVFLGGNFAEEKVSAVGSSSPLISINQASIANQDFGADVSVISFQIEIAESAPKGEYSLYLQTANGEKVFLPGSLTIDNVVNDFQSRFLTPQ